MRRLIIRLFLLALIGGPIAFAIAAFEPEPLLPASAALTPQQAAQSRELVRRARTVARDTAGAAEFTATRAELDGLIATAARAFPGLRGRNRIDADGLATRLSLQAPFAPQLGWVNLSVDIDPSPDGLDVRAIRLGRMNLPAGLTVRAARIALDLATAEDIGAVILASVTAVRTSRDRVRLSLDTGGRGDASLFSRVLDGVREATGTGGGAAAEAHYAAMAQAARDGRLPGAGSAAPWLRFAVTRAAENGGSEAEMRAAILALAAHCGDRKAIETVAGAMGAAARSACEGTVLGGRDDLRKHFSLSAAFQVAGGSALSFGLGEVKELVDAGREGGSGYSFDDIAADRAGLRWAEAAVAAARAGALPAFAAAIADEGALMPSIEGLPSRMPEAEFQRRYGQVDSPAYAAQIAEIDGRIDALAVHR